MTTTVDKKNDKKDEGKAKTITEGSTTMSCPADEESTVFYNPVQVQNRDLSILMLTLYSERRAVRNVVATERARLRKHNQGKDGNDRMSGAEIQEKLEEYAKNLNPSQVVQKQSKQDGMSILDALAASGLRSIRYWKEIPGVKHVTINDLEEAAVERAHANVKGNGLVESVIPKEEELMLPLEYQDDKDAAPQRPVGIQIRHGDAKMEMYLSQRPQSLKVHSPVHQQLKPRWDVIDLDPYGSAAPFLDAAVQSVESGGMLCVTCTDMAALGGSHPETCYGRYASMPIPSARYLQEVALRILLHSMATTAAKYGRVIKPILCVGMDFYIRCFVEVYDDKASVPKLSLMIGSVYQSTQCPSFHVVKHGRLGGKKGTVYQPERAPATLQCEETGAELKVGGPLWLGPLHDAEVVHTALKRVSSSSNSSTLPNMGFIATRPRLEGLLTSVSEELLDVPLYYGLPDLSKTLHCATPPMNMVKAALINGGYRVSGYHKDPQAVKTDAPNRFLWDIFRAWVKKNALSKEPAEGSPAAKILAVEPTSDIDFTMPKSLKQASVNRKAGGKVTRFPMNPQAHWGPKAKASGQKRKSEER